jgi:hypothetical protein
MTDNDFQLLIAPVIVMGTVGAAAWMSAVWAVRRDRYLSRALTAKAAAAGASTPKTSSPSSERRAQVSN